MHSISLRTMVPLIATMPRRSTSGFHRSGRHRVEPSAPGGKQGHGENITTNVAGGNRANDLAYQVRTSYFVSGGEEQLTETFNYRNNGQEAKYEPCSNQKRNKKRRGRGRRNYIATNIVFACTDVG